MLGSLTVFVIATGWAILTFVSRLLNLLTGGRFSQPICARIGRNALLGTRPAWFWTFAEGMVNRAFFIDRDHCFRSFVRHCSK